MTNNNQVNNLQTLKSQEYLTIYLNNNSDWINDTLMHWFIFGITRASQHQLNEDSWAGMNS